jgi:3-dehydroquinate dehydratase-2
MKGCVHGYLGGLFSIHNKESIVAESQKCRENYDGIIIDAVGYTHYSVAIRDALEGGNIPTVKVHLSNIFAREEFRRITITGRNVVGIIAGL